jgi:DNA-binding IclR family transcriptional regulator
VGSEDQLRALLGDHYPQRTPRTISTAEELWADIVRTRERGYGVDDQENEMGINCVALPVKLDPSTAAIGAVSVSALAFRHPLPQLIERVDEIRSVISDFRGTAAE